MLDEPDFPAEKIIACLLAEFGLPIVQVQFMPLGTDLSTALYRAVAEDETPYFCKIKRGVFDDTSVELPKFLSEKGIAQVIPPFLTKTGQLRAALDETSLVVYPFVEGMSGYDKEMTNRQWSDFGTALKQVHTTELPLALIRNIQTETFASDWRERCKKTLSQLDDWIFDDPVVVELAELLHSRSDQVLELIGCAETIAPMLTARDLEFVLCHSDIHPGNLLLEPKGEVFIVDWDYPMHAPKERDLMFIGGGQGFVGRTAQEEEKLFYGAYGHEPVDPMTLGYYRCERNVIDIVVACEQILFSKQDGQDRAQSLQYLKWYFAPNGPIEIALNSGMARS